MISKVKKWGKNQQKSHFCLSQGLNVLIEIGLRAYFKAKQVVYYLFKQKFFFKVSRTNFLFFLYWHFFFPLSISSSFIWRRNFFQFLTLSLNAVVLIFLTVAKGAVGVGLTAPFQIAFLGQSLFLFSPVCRQSHSEASGPKVSWSIIPILHCKQTGCTLSRCVPDTEISSLSAVDKIYMFGKGRHPDRQNPLYKVQQNSQKRV